jgi:2-methylaconitate cis-trans-isomerase PrpF
LDLPPVVTGTGVVAGSVVAATAASMGRREEIRQAHPTGYLLGLKRELGPIDAVAAVRTAFRRATRRRSTRR